MLEFSFEGMSDKFSMMKVIRRLPKLSARIIKRTSAMNWIVRPAYSPRTCFDPLASTRAANAAA